VGHAPDYDLDYGSSVSLMTCCRYNTSIIPLRCTHLSVSLTALAYLAQCVSLYTLILFGYSSEAHQDSSSSGKTLALGLCKATRASLSRPLKVDCADRFTDPRSERERPLFDSD
jgi:hypothetical protein